MALFDLLIPILYVAVFGITFIFGFLLVYRNLKKINLIEGEKFTVEDWISCLAFGSIFAVVVTFAVNMTMDVLIVDAILNIAGFLLLILIGFLFAYPLWEIFFLGRPTSDAVHGFHKFLETKILDKFRGKVAYLISFLIFMIIYIVPIIVISTLTSIDPLAIAFVWFLVFPLFFLNSYAASGQMSNIVGVNYRSTIKSNLQLAKPTLMQKMMKLIFMGIAWAPIILSIYNIYNPMSDFLSGEPLKPGKSEMMGYISLLTTVIFGIQGFFKRFWNKKSKTKTIDFIFSGYIFIAIGINMLLNFIAINGAVVNNILNISIFSWQPLQFLSGVFTNPAILLPLIIIQDITKLVFSLLLFFDKDFISDIRLASVNNAFGQRIEQVTLEGQAPAVESVPTKKGKKKKVDISTLEKSVFLPPLYDSDGIDMNNIIRQKAAQYLFLISVTDKNLAKQIVEITARNSIEADPSGLKYLSKEAVDLLGNIGKVHPDLILDRFTKALGTAAPQLQTHILDAIGDIGESKANLIQVLEKLKPLLVTSHYELRVAAYNSIVEMVTEGQYSDKEFVQLALTPIYQALQDQYHDAEIIDNALEAVLKMCAKVAKDVDFAKIQPFLKYNEGTEEQLKEYITENTISILAAIVYFNLDKFPLAEVRKFLKNDRSYIRYVTVDAIGNYILEGGTDEEKNSVILEIIDYALHDSDIDVVSMCGESIAEFLVMRPGFQITHEGQAMSILDYFIKMLDFPDARVAENASETLKSIAPIYQENIYPKLAAKIQSDNLEIVRDIMHTLGLVSEAIHKQVDLNLLYQRVEHKDPSVRAEAIFALGGIAQHRADVDSKILAKCLDDVDPQVRLEAIFALGKLGVQRPDTVVPILIEMFFQLDRTSGAKVSEVELYAESLGTIGARYPSNEIIITLQQALMGDTNIFAKDIVAKALGRIGNGMIKSGKATRRIQDEAFYNAISWFQAYKKQEYTIGNLIIIFIEALQQRNIPESVMDIISDSVQDLLPVFAVIEGQNKKHPNEIILSIKGLLAQAYYSNYNQEILETIDRIDSLLNFKRIFEVQDPAVQEEYKFFAEQYTPDGKQFADQGDTFMELGKQNPRFLDYALKSYQIAIELAPNEYYTPTCFMQLGFIFKSKNDLGKARENFEIASELFAAQDEIDAMKRCEENIAALK